MLHLLFIFLPENGLWPFEIAALWKILVSWDDYSQYMEKIKAMFQTTSQPWLTIKNRGYPLGWIDLDHIVVAGHRGQQCLCCERLMVLHMLCYPQTGDTTSPFSVRKPEMNRTSSTLHSVQDLQDVYHLESGRLKKGGMIFIAWTFMYRPILGGFTLSNITLWQSNIDFWKIHQLCSMIFPSSSPKFFWGCPSQPRLMTPEGILEPWKIPLSHPIILVS